MPKGYGRSKKAPHYHTLNLFDELNRLGFNPVAELVLTLAEIDDPKDRADIIEKIWRYVFPQRKAVDISATTTTASVSLTPAQLQALLASDAFRQAIPVQTSPSTSPDPVAQPALPHDPFKSSA